MKCKFTCPNIAMKTTTDKKYSLNFTIRNNNVLFLCNKWCCSYNPWSKTINGVNDVIKLNQKFTSIILGIGCAKVETIELFQNFMHY